MPAPRFSITCVHALTASSERVVARTLCWKPSAARVVHISARCQSHTIVGNRALGFVGAHCHNEEAAGRRKHMLKLREQTIENLPTVLPCIEMSMRASKLRQ